MKCKSIITLIESLSTELRCIRYLEKAMWPRGPECPRCGEGNIYSFRDKRRHKCSRCQMIFKVTTGTVMEGTKLSLKKWIIAMYLLTSSKKGISSVHLSTMIGVTQKTAWFMLHRLRRNLKDQDPTPLSGIIEVDETFVGGKNKNRHKDKKFDYSKLKGRMFEDKTPVLGLLERTSRKVRLFVIPNTKQEHIKPIIFKNVYANSNLYTDDWGAYKSMGLYYHHKTVDHSRKQFKSGDAYTNSIEGLWSILKRGIIGIYHRVSRKHLQRYCNEFAFRYNNREGDIMTTAFRTTIGRLKYKDLTGSSEA